MRRVERMTMRQIDAGYASDELVDVVVRKTAAIQDGDALDAAVPGDIRLPTLLAVALAGDRVLDFGGAAGLHYLVSKRAFPSRPFRWAVVETPLMVARAKILESDGLHFFSDLDAATKWLGAVDLMHSVGALQYAPEPEAALDRLLALRAPMVLWAKLELGERRELIEQRTFLRHNGPGALPAGVVDAIVACRPTRLPKARFLAAHRDYRLIWRDGGAAFMFTAEPP